jgi:short subunit dehydrogenase-like uncharacterized protein
MSISNQRWMIYGANGYTAGLIAEEAARRGYQPVLAGRNAEAVAAVAVPLKLDSRSFSLEDTTKAAAALEDIDAVLHCAGPFSATAEPMLRACIASKTHYLDITGEIEIFELAKSLGNDAAAAGCVLMPGVGFDVVATDCLAAKLNTLIENPTHLEMAFCGDGGASPGTAKTFVEMLPDGGRVRANGQITKVPAAAVRRSVAFSDRTEWCMSIPWGDISTAYSTTSIPNITVLTAVPRAAAFITRLTSPLMAIMKPQGVQNKLKQLVEKHVHGPDQPTRESGCMRLWGKVTNVNGESAEQWLDLLDGYDFTVHASLAVMEHLLEQTPPAGYHTPAGAYGYQLIESIQGSSWKQP